jgi:hypothetical protein
MNNINSYIPLENYLHSKDSSILPEYVRNDIEELLKDYKNSLKEIEKRNDYIVERCLNEK